MEPYNVLVRDGSRISQEKKNPSGIAGNGVSTTCYTPRNGVRKVAPPRFLRRFLICYFSKFTAYVFKHVPGSALDSIQFILEVDVFKKLFYLRTDENVFFYPRFYYVWKLLP